ncbi:hypothetical protein JZ785_05640 [Alicyclobacillus curvatus]|nr:hypothetical protein JZ785_05640 [Alicyclobacillus curvatus]
MSRLIPTLQTTVVVIRTQRLVQCLDRATVIAPKTQEIQFFVDDTQLVVFTESADYGKSTDVLVAESVAGDRAELRVNGRNVLEALRTCTSEEVVLQFTGKNRPLVLLPKNGTDLVHVISPIVSR